MREDLLALSAEALAVLANVGLLKRAQRELAAGQRPEIVEDESGQVVGTFREAGGELKTRLPPGKTLRDALCSCGAPGVCRHRVALVLAYQEERSGSAPATAAGDSDQAFSDWSPGAIPDEALLALLGQRLFNEASATRRRGLVVAITRPRAEQPIPLASLPTCSVRFLARLAPGFARCDCEIGSGCIHVALAVWAFRQADRQKPEALELQVELRPELEALAAEAGGAAGAITRGLVQDLLLEGAVHIGKGLDQRFAMAREEQAAAVWMLDLLESLELELARRERRSSLFRKERLADLLAGLEARPRALGGELPSLYLLGSGEKAETRLDRVRLISLGARLEADGRDRYAELLLADPDAGTVLLCEKTFSFGDQEKMLEGADLAQRRMAGSHSLRTLAGGQLLTHAAKRRANRLVIFGQMTATNTSLLPQKGDWQVLPSPLRIESVAQLAELGAERPPRLLRPRLRTEAVHVVPLAEVATPFYDPARQELACWAELGDSGEGEIRIALHYRSCAPGAIDALAAALGGRWGKPRFVAGEVHKRAGFFEIEPTAIAADHLVVPDLEPVGLKVPVGQGREAAPPHPLHDAVGEAGALLDEIASQGLRHLPAGFPERLGERAKSLAELGLDQLARRLEQLGREVALAREGKGREAWQETAEAYIRAILRQRLTAELL